MCVCVCGQELKYRYVPTTYIWHMACIAYALHTYHISINRQFSKRHTLIMAKGLHILHSSVCAYVQWLYSMAYGLIERIWWWKKRKLWVCSISHNTTIVSQSYYWRFLSQHMYTHMTCIMCCVYGTFFFCLSLYPLAFIVTFSIAKGKHTHLHMYGRIMQWDLYYLKWFLLGEICN